MRALAVLHRALTLNRVRSRAGFGQTASDNLYVRGLDSGWTEADLSRLFSTYGNVKVRARAPCSARRPCPPAMPVRTVTLCPASPRSSPGSVGPGSLRLSRPPDCPVCVAQEVRLLQGDETRGVGGLVRMGTVEEAGRAVEALGKPHPAGGAMVVRYADSPEEKLRYAACWPHALRCLRHRTGPGKAPARCLCQWGRSELVCQGLAALLG